VVGEDRGSTRGEMGFGGRVVLNLVRVVGAALVPVGERRLEKRKRWEIVGAGSG
jgi:hypothetical protein